MDHHVELSKSITASRGASLTFKNLNQPKTTSILSHFYSSSFSFLPKFRVWAWQNGLYSRNKNEDIFKGKNKVAWIENKIYVVLWQIFVEYYYQLTFSGEFWVSINSYFWRVFFLYIPTSEFWCLSGWIHPYAYNHLKFSLHWKNHLRTTTIGIHTTQNCFKIWWMVIAYSKRFTVCIVMTFIFSYPCANSYSFLIMHFGNNFKHCASFGMQWCPLMIGIGANEFWATAGRQIRDILKKWREHFFHRETSATPFHEFFMGFIVS